MALTKADLAENLFNELGLNKREAKEFVEILFCPNDLRGFHRGRIAKTGGPRLATDHALVRGTDTIGVDRVARNAA